MTLLLTEPRKKPTIFSKYPDFKAYRVSSFSILDRYEPGYWSIGTK